MCLFLHLFMLYRGLQEKAKQLDPKGKCGRPGEKLEKSCSQP
jgi:hypothetical protein